MRRPALEAQGLRLLRERNNAAIVAAQNEDGLCAPLRAIGALNAAIPQTEPESRS